MCDEDVNYSTLSKTYKIKPLILGETKKMTDSALSFALPNLTLPNKTLLFLIKCKILPLIKLNDASNYCLYFIFYFLFLSLRFEVIGWEQAIFPFLSDFSILFMLWV